MKKSTTNKLYGALLALAALAVNAEATVTGVGTDTTTGANWRTAAALETDNEYGTDGYVIYGVNEADGVFSNPYAFDKDQTVLPAAITGVTTNTVQMWSGNGGFGTMEDPGNGNAITNTSLSVLLNSTSSTFTISRVAGTSFRLTLLAASDSSNATYNNTVDDGSGGVLQSSTHTSNGLHYHVFDISSGSSDVVVSTSVPGGATQHFSLTGLAFDNVVTLLLPVVDDSATTDHLTFIYVPVLDNDNPTGTVTLVEVVDAPASGTAVVQPDNSIRYTHTTGTPSSDSFTYRYTDDNGVSDLGTVTITLLVPPTRWVLNGDGDWNTQANWSSNSVPNAAAAAALLDSDGGNITGPVTATLNVPVTLGRLTFGHSFPYTVAGTNALTFDYTGSGAAVNVQSGDHVISAPVTLADDVTASVATGASLELSNTLAGGSDDDLAKSGAGNLVLAGDISGFTGQTTIGAGTVTLARPGDYTLTQDFGGSGRLAFTGGGRVTLAPAFPNSHGGTNLSNGGTLVVDSVNDLGATGGVAFDNGMLEVGGDITAATAGWSVAAGGGTIDVAAGFTLQSGRLTGTGAINKTGDGTWRIATGGAAAHVGAVTVTGGTLDLNANDVFGGQAESQTDLTIEADALVTNGANPTNSGYNSFRNLTLNGGELRVTGTAGPLTVGMFPSYALKNTVTAAGSSPSSITDPGSLANSAINLGNGDGTQTNFAVANATGDAAVDLSISAVLQSFNTGTGLRKTGAGTLQLTRANTYTGNTTVEEGTLILDQAFLANTADVELTTGATLQLDFAGSDTINALRIDGSPQDAGTWGRTGHPTAQHTSSLITGDGLLHVGAAPAGYTGWAEDFLPAFTNTAADLDFENDGLASGIEWVVGGDPTVNDAATFRPTFDNTSDPDDFLLTFRRRDEAAADPNTTIAVEYGSDLTGWASAQDGVGGVSIDDTTDLGGGFHEVTVTIPRTLDGASGKLFARLKVTVTTP